jgi:hypothetical protein
MGAVMGTVMQWHTDSHFHDMMGTVMQWHTDFHGLDTDFMDT